MLETKNNNIEKDYKNFVGEIVQKQMLILGPQIAFDKAKNIEGLAVDTAGSVISLSGDPYLVVKNLIDEYSSLSREITQTVLCSIIEKYPALKEAFSRAITKIELDCPYLLEEGQI